VRDPAHPAPVASPGDGAHLALLARISRTLVLDDGADARAMQSVYGWLAEALGFEKFFHYQVGPAPESLDLVACGGISPEDRAALAHIRFGEYLCGIVAREREPLICNDLAASPYAEAAMLCAAGVRAYAGVPLVARGTLLGTVAFATVRDRPITEADLRMIETVCDEVAVHLSRLQIERHLRDREAHLRLAMQASLAVVFEWDILANRVHRLLSSIDFLPETAIQADTLEGVAQAIHPDDRALFLHRVQRAVAAPDGIYHAEFRVGRSGGPVRWLAESGQVERDAAGKPIRLVGISHDVTERRKAEDALRLADRRKDDFIATLAHELRNPLAPIRNAVNVLRQVGPRVPRLDWARDVIDRQVGQMAPLLDDLLDVSRITRSKLALRCERVTLGTVIDMALETARPVIDAAGHRLDIVLPPESMPLDGDPVRLGQVFANLLTNAAKYTDTGGCIAITAVRDPRTVVVSVTDNGIGIDPAHLHSVFEMFGQVDHALDRAQGGLGIGLALVKGLVTMHGGTVEAASAGRGHGSTFTVRLPLAANDMGEAPGSGPPLIASAAPCRVLVADDLRDNTDSLAMLLRALGHEVRTAYDGEAAVAACATFRPHVAIVDIGMPRLNGLEACRRIRALPGGDAILMVAQTGWGQEDDARRARDAGFDHFLVKPADPGRLATLIDQAGRNA